MNRKQRKRQHKQYLKDKRFIRWWNKLEKDEKRFYNKKGWIWPWQ